MSESVLKGKAIDTVGEDIASEEVKTEEIAPAQENPKATAGAYDYLKWDLAETLEFQGQQVKSLDLTKLKDFTLNELNDIYDTYAAFGGAGMVMQEATLRFAQLTASAVTGYPIEMIGMLKAKDAVYLKNRVYRFFFH